MLFNDIHCTFERAFPKIGSQSVCQTLLGLGWEGVVAVNRSLNWSIKYHYDYQILNHAVWDFLSDYARQLYCQKENYPYRVFYYRNVYFLVLPLREEPEKEQVVFCLNAKKEPFDSLSLDWYYYSSMLDYKCVQLENSLEQAETYLENILSISKTISVFFDTDLTIQSMNTEARNIFGDKTNVLDLEISQIKYLAQNILESICTGHKVFLDKDIVCTNNDRVLSVEIGPLFDKSGVIVGGLLVGRDITEYTLLVFEQRMLNRFSILGETATMLAHDVKNPLMNIKVCAQLLEDDCSDVDKQDLCCHIEQEADRIKHLINQMLSYSKAISETTYEQVQVNRLLTNCATIIRREMVRKDVSIELELYSELPLIWAVSIDLQQVFFRIIENSVDALKEKGNIKIKSTYNALQNSINVTIFDNGIGIADDDIGKLFKPYFTTKKHGTGLGLFSAKRIIERYHGTIHFLSKVNLGTTCTICIPCKQNIDGS